MSAPSARNIKRRQKKAKHKNQKKLAQQQRKDSVRRFPNVVIQANDAPPRLVEAVRKAVTRIRAESESLLGEDAKVFHALKIIGIDHLKVASASTGRVPDTNELTRVLTSILGNAIDRLIPASIKDAYLSYSSYIAGVGVPNPEGITIWFETFLTEKTKFGTVYFSPRRPTITIDGQKGEIAYSTHALRRRSQRTGNISSNSYKARVFSFQAAYHLESVQPWHDEEGKPGFVFAERVSNPLSNVLIDKWSANQDLIENACSAPGTVLRFR